MYGGDYDGWHRPYYPLDVSTIFAGKSIQLLDSNTPNFRYTKMTLLAVHPEVDMLFAAASDGVIHVFSGEADSNNALVIVNSFRQTEDRHINRLECQHFQALGMVLLVAVGGDPTNEGDPGFLSIWLLARRSPELVQDHTMVEIPLSAWGLATDTWGNLMAISSNAHDIRIVQLLPPDSSSCPASRRVAQCWKPDQFLGSLDTVQVRIASRRNAIRAHNHNIPCLDFSSDGKRLVSGSIDGVIALWDVEEGTKVLELCPRGVPTDPRNWVWSVALVPESAVSCLGEMDDVWNLSTRSTTDNFVQKTLEGMSSGYIGCSLRYREYLGGLSEQNSDLSSDHDLSSPHPLREFFVCPGQTDDECGQGTQRNDIILAGFGDAEIRVFRASSLLLSKKQRRHPIFPKPHFNVTRVPLLWTALEDSEIGDRTASEFFVGKLGMVAIIPELSLVIAASQGVKGKLWLCRLVTSASRRMSYGAHVVLEHVISEDCHRDPDPMIGLVAHLQPTSSCSALVQVHIFTLRLSGALSRYQITLHPAVSLYGVAGLTI